MSKVKELADKEAARAEAGEGADVPTPEPQPEGDEPEAPHPDDGDELEAHAPQVNAEKQMREYVSEMQRHADEWARISGVPAETLEACPTCSGAGFLDKPLKVSAHHQMCDECNGYGQVISGSLNPNSATTQCTKCQGYGHIAKTPEAQTYTPPPNGEPPVTLAPVTSDPPEAAALRAQGYTVVPPISVTTQ